MYHKLPGTDLYCCEYYASVYMLELWHDAFTDMLALLLILGNATCKGV